MSEEREATAIPSSSSSDEAEIIPGYTSIEQFTKDGFKILMEAIKTSNALPSGRDLNFYNLSDSFKKIINKESSNVLRLMNHVMQCQEVDSNIRNRVLDEKIELIIEANDIILEKVANNIDDLNGVRTTTVAPPVLQTVSAHLPVNGSWNRPTSATFSVNASLPQSKEQNCIKLLTAKNIVRPQKFFKDKIDNRNKIPWYPRITDKPNSLKPLAIFLEECEDRQEYSHPYEFELDRFTPTPKQLLEEKPKFPKPISDTPLIEVTKPEQLDRLVENLRTRKEFAVDVEHHSYRSFLGITCLLQISTEDEDYLIDALALRDKLWVLNEVFTKNSIVKIFHGAENDIEWLQKDLSLYVVNMFDTHQAAKVLEYNALSLAFLMKKFCDILPNKQFQLADWRIRPLPDELKSYAREDTHYLIYIYKMLKKELLLKANKADNLLKSVIEQSTEICRKRYFKPLLLEESHLNMYRKFKKMFDNRQMYALKELYAWRDNLAREEDESLGYVMPNHMMLQIAETLPREMQGILACCNPIPPLVRSNLLQLHQIVLKARDQPLEKAIAKDTTGPGVLKKVSKLNVDSPLHCPHDLSKSQEFRDDLPTLLKDGNLKTDLKKIASVELSIEKPSSYSIFDVLSDSDDVFNERDRFKKLRGFAYFSPFERYKLVKPFALAEDQVQKDEEDKKPQEESKVVSEERTDEDRIASIKDHFLQLSKKFSEELQAQKQKEEEEEKQLREQSLKEMGGSRKRKRDHFDEPSDQTYSNDFRCPKPNINPSQAYMIRKRKSQKKRKFDDAFDNNGGREMHNQQMNSKKNKKNKQNQQQRQQANNQSPQKPKPKNQNKQGRGAKQQNQQKAKQQNQQKQKQKQKQNPKNFEPYDYASVDFRQFQGGAGSANSGAQIKPNFKAKNRKNKNKRGAKSSTFGNTMTNRGGYHQNRNY